MLQLIYYPPKD